jgi:hypothetical protein
MKPAKIPATDSIEELAEFWDSHDLTDFEAELEAVSEPVFQREPVLKLRLSADELDAVKDIARSQGVRDADLVHGWIREKLRTA